MEYAILILGQANRFKRHIVQDGIPSSHMLVIEIGGIAHVLFVGLCEDR